MRNKLRNCMIFLSKKYNNSQKIHFVKLPSQFAYEVIQSIILFHNEANCLPTPGLIATSLPLRRSASHPCKCPASESLTGSQSLVKIYRHICVNITTYIIEHIT